MDFERFEAANGSFTASATSHRGLIVKVAGFALAGLFSCALLPSFAFANDASASDQMDSVVHPASLVSDDDFVDVDMTIFPVEEPEHEVTVEVIPSDSGSADGDQTSGAPESQEAGSDAKGSEGTAHEQSKPIVDQQVENEASAEVEVAAASTSVDVASAAAPAPAIAPIAAGSHATHGAAGSFASIAYADQPESASTAKDERSIKDLIPLTALALFTRRCRKVTE